MKIEITQERLDALHEMGVTHLVVPSKSVPDRIEYIKIPYYVIGDHFWEDSRPYILPEGTPKGFKAVLWDGFRLPAYDPDGFIPSYASPKSSGLIIREDGTIPDIEKKTKVDRINLCAF